VSSVAFQPWVGRNYGRGSRWGVSVLLLGYSHYHEFQEVGHAEYTRHVVGRHVRGINDRSPYRTKLARAFECTDGRGAFWDSVAFYNYVQDFMTGPRENPDPQQIRAAWTPFNEVFRELNPDLTIATGKQLWTALSARLPRPEHLSLPDGGRVPYVVLSRGTGAGVVSHIKHPSTGFSYDEWCPVVAALLDEARARVTA
jgi:hypothetical protein